MNEIDKGTGKKLFPFMAKHLCYAVRNVGKLPPAGYQYAFTEVFRQVKKDIIPDKLFSLYLQSSPPAKIPGMKALVVSGRSWLQAIALNNGNIRTGVSSNRHQPDCLFFLSSQTGM
jgi:hypothetical protein